MKKSSLLLALAIGFVMAECTQAAPIPQEQMTAQQAHMSSDAYAHEHLSFKGIPIDGSMYSFCKKLKSKGFVYLESEDNMRIFSGNFAGRNAMVAVAATNNEKDVYMVFVSLPASDEWNTLVATYNYYKDLYVHKYGEPSVCEEKNPAHNDSNIALMAEVYKGTVNYGSAWVVAGGVIAMSIIKTRGIYEGQVGIIYLDSQNGEAKEKQNLDDI